MGDTPLFSASGLACRRGERLVFAGLEFALEAGGALLLKGSNGSGKSSLLRLMAGLARPEAGHISWHGAAIDDDREAHAARLHFLGHLDGVKPALSVSENLRYWARLRGATGDVVALEAALGKFGLARLIDAPARYLSAGQRRRLALSRLLASPAPLWLLDEPTTGLDDDSVKSLEAAMAEHRAGGGLIVAATHTEIALPGAQELRLEKFARGLVLDEAA